MCPIFLPQDLRRRALRRAPTSLSNASATAALTQRCGHCASSPGEAQKPANLEDPGIRSASDRPFSNPARRKAAKTNIRRPIHCQDSNIEWRDCVIKHKRGDQELPETSTFFIIFLSLRAFSWHRGTVTDSFGNSTQEVRQTQRARCRPRQLCATRDILMRLSS